LRLLVRLVRGMGEEEIRSLMEQVISESRRDQDGEAIKSLFVLTFQTRWCRGGKGERALFLVMTRVLYEKFPDVVLELLELVPKFGYWKDLLFLLQGCRAADMGKVSFDKLADRVWTLFAAQLQEDHEELLLAKKQQREPRLSLCSKYAPTEGHAFDRELHAVRSICGKMYGEVLGASKQPEKAARYVKGKYRKVLAELRRALQVCETKMCSNSWDSIDFSRVPSLAVKRYMKAFLNESATDPSQSRSEDAARLACREAFLEASRANKLNGKQLFPHDLVKEVWATCEDLPESKREVYQSMWGKIREGVEEMIEQRKAELQRGARDLEDALAVKAANESSEQVSQVLAIVQEALEDKALETRSSRPVNLGKTIAMCDVSGSMMGVPMYVSVALGILCSEVSPPAYRDRILTFSSEPAWHELSQCASFVDKVRHVREADFEMGTDIYKAMQLVLELVRRERLSADDIPNLLIISDMQFDEASTEAPQTLHENLKELFAEAGMSLYGKPLEVPQIIFWNVNQSCSGFHAEPDAPGITMLSGFSPSLLKFVLSGELEKELLNSKEKMSAKGMLESILKEEGLAPVREALDKMDKKLFVV